MPLAPSDFEYVRTLVHERGGIVLEPSKAYLVETRLAPLVREHGMGSISALVGRLRGQRHGGLHSAVVEALTTNETSFFRDVHPFEALRQVLIPELVKQRSASKSLVIWSAACSSGQEPYTVAIVIREHFPQLANWNIRIMATDLSEAILTKAASGLYTQMEVSRGLPAPLLVKYFKREGASWRLSPEIRRMVTFKKLNLTQSWPAMGPVDLLMLRNVLIYFDLATKRAILERARQVLRSDGMLLLGGTETTLGVDDRYQRVAVDRTVYYRVP